MQTVPSSNPAAQIIGDVLTLLRAYPDPSLEFEADGVPESDSNSNLKSDSDRIDSSIDYESFPFNTERAKALIATLEGDILEQLIEDDDTSLLEFHAARILIKHKHFEAIPAMVRYVAEESDQDWITDEIHYGLIQFGPVVIEPIIQFLESEPVYYRARYGFSSLAEILSNVAQTATEAQKAKALGCLRARLQNYELQPPVYNMFLADSLAELGDSEATDLILEVIGREFTTHREPDAKWVCEKLGIDFADTKRFAPRNQIESRRSYIGDEKFQQLIRSTGILFSVDQIKLLILGAILAVDFVTPQSVLNILLNNSFDDEAEDFADSAAFGDQASGDSDSYNPFREEPIDFETEGQVNYFMGVFMSLWNELTQYQDHLYPLNIQEQSNQSPALDPEIRTVFRAIKIRHDISCFIEGLDLGTSEAVKLMNPKVASFIGYCRQAMDRIDEFSTQTDLGSESARLRTEDEIKSLGLYWSSHYVEFTEALKAARLKELERQRRVAISRDVGRNDPCPCGSGIKFKKCCLTVN